MPGPVSVSGGWWPDLSAKAHEVGERGRTAGEIVLTVA
jgi:hypothetical protein